MTRARPNSSRGFASRREQAPGNVIALPDAGQRRQRAALWTHPSMTQRTAAYDAMIRQTWRLHLAGVFGWTEAGEVHHALIRLRDGREVVL